MKLQYKIIIISGILIASAAAFAVTGDEAVAKFRARMGSIGKMTGVISWTSSSGYTYTGHFKYLAPNNIYVKFSSPGGKIIVANGKKLWVYDPSTNIVGIQDLDGGASGGIAGMTGGYMAIASSQGSGYLIKLKNNEKYYSEINIAADASFMMKKIMLKTKEGEGVTYSISNVDTSASVNSNMFDFSVPANAQAVKNPLNIR